MHARCLCSTFALARRPTRRLLSTVLGQPSPSPPDSTSLTSDSNNDLSDFVDQVLKKNPSAINSPLNDETSEGIEQGRKDKERTNSRSALVKVEYGVKNLPTGLAVVQNIERRFGRIRDFKLMPDRNAPGDYLPYLFVEFEDIHTLRQIQRAGKKAIKFTIEPWDRGQVVDGGPSLYDVQDYLRRPSSAGEPEETVDAVENDASVDGTDEKMPPSSSEDGENSEKMTSATENVEEEPPELYSRARNEINVQIVPLADSFDSTQFSQHIGDESRNSGRATQARISQAFLRWGGFYPYDFSDIGMETAAWRAHPYGKEPPSSIASSLSERDLRFVLSDKEVQRARRVHKAQSAMKAAQYRRREMLKDLSASLAGQGLVYDEESMKWRMKGPVRSGVAGGVSGGEEVDVIRVVNEGVAQTKPDVEEKKPKRPETIVNEPKYASDPEVQSLPKTREEARKPDTANALGSERLVKPLVVSERTPTPNPSSLPQGSNQKNPAPKRKVASSPIDVSSINGTSTKGEKSKIESTKSSPKGRNSQEDNLKSRILGWLKGGW